MGLCKNAVLSIIAVIFTLVTASTALSAGGGYTPGTEGAMAPTLPPPGFHYKQYNIFVDADTLVDADGNDVPIDFSVKVFAQAHRFVWITDKKLFGADYGMSLIVPIVAKDIEILDTEDSDIGLGDIFIEPLVFSWHKERWDIALGLGANLPTGDWDNSGKPANGSPGSGGYGSGLLTFGPTYYLDQGKSWAISALTRTVLYFGEQDDTDYQPGDEFIIDWGISKQFAASQNLLIRPALVGYTYWQISDDDNGTNDDKGSKYALGAEVNFFWLPRLMQFNIRYLQDVEVEDESENTTVVLSITSSF